MAERTKKIVSIAEAVGLVRDGMTLAIGGIQTTNAPLALVRGLIKKGVRDLTLVPGVVSGVQSDMLIGAGCVKRLYCSSITLEFLGLAPNFRRQAESGDLDVIECDEFFILKALRAGATDLPFHPVPPGGHYGSDLPKVNPAYKTTIDPYSGNEVLVVPPLQPDVCFIHTSKSDPYGNAQHLGHLGADDVMAEASSAVVVSCEEIVPLEETMANHLNVTIPSLMVNAVVYAPFGCHPGECHSNYTYDPAHLELYATAAQDVREMQRYLDTYVHEPQDHFAYLDLIGARVLMDLALHRKEF